MGVALQMHGVHLAHDVGGGVASLVTHLVADALVLAQQLLHPLAQHLILPVQPVTLLGAERGVALRGGGSQGEMTLNLRVKFLEF